MELKQNDRAVCLHAVQEIKLHAITGKTKYGFVIKWFILPATVFLLVIIF